MTFAFFIGLTVFLGYLSIEKGRRWLLPIALLPCAFAILTKGPAGLVIPVAVLFFYCLATKRLRAMFLPMVVGCLLSLAVASIWFMLAGKAYADEFLLRQNITRYIDRLRPHRILLVLFPQTLRQFSSLEHRPALRRLFRVQETPLASPSLARCDVPLLSRCPRASGPSICFPAIRRAQSSWASS